MMLIDRKKELVRSTGLKPPTPTPKKIRKKEKTQKLKEKEGKFWKF